MSQKIVFQDNIFQITRSLDLIKDGMSLELSEELFAKKTINDILFFDFALQSIFSKVEAQTQLPSYLDTMQCLYFSIIKFADILATMLSKKDNNSILINNIEKFESMYTIHQDLLTRIREIVQDDNITQDTVNIVSQNELSELLNFG